MHGMNCRNALVLGSVFGVSSVAVELVHGLCYLTPGGRALDWKNEIHMRSSKYWA